MKTIEEVWGEMYVIIGFSPKLTTIQKTDAILSIQVGGKVECSECYGQGYWYTNPLGSSGENKYMCTKCVGKGKISYPKTVRDCLEGM